MVLLIRQRFSWNKTKKSSDISFFFSSQITFAYLLVSTGLYNILYYNIISIDRILTINMTTRLFNLSKPITFTPCNQLVYFDYGESVFISCGVLRGRRTDDTFELLK